MYKSFALSLAVMLAASPLAAAPPGGPAGGSANTLDEELTLNTAITVEGGAVTLGDIFQGYLTRPEKIVAEAPKPGQRLTLTAEWLAETARTYGLNWRPTNDFDRAVVYQPGLTLTSADILAAVKDALIANGMPANYGVRASVAVNPVTVAVTAQKDIGVREAVYYPSAKQFSALVQIPPNDPQAAFIPVRGAAFPTVQVPVLKEAAGRNSTITADMIDLIDLPEDQVKPATLIDPNHLIGKSPKTFLKAGHPIRDSEVTQVTLVELPVLATDVDRDGRITAAQVKMMQVNAAHVPADAVTSPEFLIGKTPRRSLHAGAPIRRADVSLVRQVEVPVAARDVARGTTLTDSDFTWVMMDETDVVGDLPADESEIVGQMARVMLRAGQPVRKHAIAKSILVERGQSVTVLWSVTAISLSAQGQAMEKGGAGDVIRVTNTKSNQTVLAEIIDSRTVRVATPDRVSSR